MRSRLDFVPAFAACAAFCLGFAAGPSVAQTETMTPALKELAAAADKEGTLLVKWSNGTFGGPQGAKLIEQHINEAYGTHIQIKWTPGGDMPSVGNEIAIAFRNNQPSPSDIYVGFSRNMAVFLKYDMFQKGDYKKYMPDRLTDDIVERDTFVRIYSSDIGFTYNKALAPSVPERLTDLLKPEWTGKVGTTPFAAGFDMLAAKEALGPEKAIEFAKQFSKQVAGFMLCNEADRVASGEFIAFATDCGGARMMQAALKGAPLVHVLAPEVPLISYFYLTVPKNAANPNAAKLFITYVLSPRGQRDTYETSLSDVDLFPDSETGKAVRAAEQKFGIKFKPTDITWQEVANEAGNGAQQQIQKILQEDRRR
jgi:ABC-type Fe3+ transport system substrate-binding protein